MTPELEAFCRREHPRLVGALTLHCGNRWVAAELAQEALARVCADWSRVSRMQAPGAWVHRVAMNLCTSHFRRRTAERAARARYQARQVPEVPPEPTETLAVRRAVGALPVRQRTALVLRYYSDLTIEQTAAAMDVAPAPSSPSPTKPSPRCAPALASPTAHHSTLGSPPVPDLSDLLAQGAGTPVTTLDLPSVQARVRQRRRRHRAALAALVLVPVLLGGAGVVALQDRGEQTLVPAAGVPDGESLGVLLSVTDGDDPVLTWQPLGPCTMQGSPGVKPSCVTSPDLPPPDRQVSAPLGEPGLRLNVLILSDQPADAQPVDLLRAFLADPGLPHRVHLTVTAGRVVALTDHEPALGVGDLIPVPPAPDGVSYADLLELTDDDLRLLWRPLSSCGRGEPVPQGASCLPPSEGLFVNPLADSADVVLAAPGGGQGVELLRAYLANPAGGHLVKLTVVEGQVVRITDALPATLDPPR